MLDKICTGLKILGSLKVPRPPDHSKESLAATKGRLVEVLKSHEDPWQMLSSEPASAMALNTTVRYTESLLVQTPVVTSTQYQSWVLGEIV